MKEKDFQTKFNKWVKHNFNGTGVFELKITHGKSIPFNAVQEHQSFALSKAKHSKIIYKIPDGGFQNPFDSFQISGAKAFVVVMFYAPNQKKFYMIDVDDWGKEDLLSSRRSLTEDRAREIGKTCLLK